MIRILQRFLFVLEYAFDLMEVGVEVAIAQNTSMGIILVLWDGMDG